MDPVEECGTGKRVAILSVDSTAIDESAGTPPLGNYPNPFNSSTVIQFSLSTAGNAQLQVYNALGQRVRELINERLEAGLHRANWDGLDDSDKRVASGVYFYRLTTDELSVTKKMVIVK